MLWLMFCNATSIHTWSRQLLLFVFFTSFLPSFLLPFFLPSFLPRTDSSVLAVTRRHYILLQLAIICENTNDPRLRRTRLVIITTQRLRLMELTSGCVCAAAQQCPSAKKRREIKRLENGVMPRLDDSQQAASCVRKKKDIRCWQTTSEEREKKIITEFEKKKIGGRRWSIW